jgi:CIC family chloride channel protein
MTLVGIMMYLFFRFTGHYYIQGVGYATIQDVLSQALANPVLLLVLCAAKLLATSLSLGSGASGGIFSPSLFMGAVLGAAYALIASHVVPGLALSPVNTAIIGMAALVAGATGAVVTAVVMIFEMTRDYYVVVPLMAAASAAYGVRRLFLRDSIYTLKLTRRGDFLPDSLQTSGYMLRTAGDALSVPTLKVDESGEMPRLRRPLRGVTQPPHLLVLEDGRLVGVVSAEDTEREELLGQPRSNLDVYVKRKFVLAAQDELLFDVVAKMRAADSELVVVTRDGSLNTVDDVVGVLAWRDIVRLSNLPPHLILRQPRAAGAGTSGATPKDGS